MKKKLILSALIVCAAAALVCIICNYSPPLSGRKVSSLQLLTDTTLFPSNLTIESFDDYAEMSYEEHRSGNTVKFSLDGHDAQAVFSINSDGLERVHITFLENSAWTTEDQSQWFRDFQEMLENKLTFDEDGHSYFSQKLGVTFKFQGREMLILQFS